MKGGLFGNPCNVYFQLCCQYLERAAILLQSAVLQIILK